MSNVLITKVKGVTYGDRQHYLDELNGMDIQNVACRIIAEPNNPYDKNALALYVAPRSGVIWNIGYVPKEVAAQIAPYIGGERIIVKIAEVTGGYRFYHDDDTYDYANYGLKIVIVLFEEQGGE
jgi:hypothetical protein